MLSLERGIEFDPHKTDLSQSIRNVAARTSMHWRNIIDQFCFASKMTSRKIVETHVVIRIIIISSRVDFINVLRTNFSYEGRFSTYMWLEKLPKCDVCAKN